MSEELAPCDVSKFTVGKDGEEVPVHNSECKNFNKCAEEGLACKDYSAFIHGGRLNFHRREPSKLIYRSIFETEAKESKPTLTV